MLIGPGGVSTYTYIDLDSRASISYEVDLGINAVSLVINDGRDIHLRLTSTILNRCIDALTLARSELSAST